MMQRLVVFAAFLSTAGAVQESAIKPGLAANGWCSGFDLAPKSNEVAANATDCFNKCKVSHPTTIAIDFWNINDAIRNENNICWCQDACTCLMPSLPGGSDGTLLMDDSVTKPASCGYNLYDIKEGVTEQGWCRSPLDAAPGVTITNQHTCYTQCKELKKAVAADYFVRDDKKVCFCQSSCPCLMASLAGGGDGLLAMDETETPSKNMCYKMKAGVAALGWCPGIDKAPADTTATTPKECYDKCKATHASTVAVDFWDINHASRTAKNVCWCQDACDCTRASKSDGGDGILFVAEGTTKGKSCGKKCDCIEPAGDGGSWDYAGDTNAGTIKYYGGCVTTSDSPKDSWCYVKDDTCIHGKASSVSGETRKWRICDPCACRSDWTYLAAGDTCSFGATSCLATTGTMNTGCLPDSEWGAWCYTQGHHGYCPESAPSLIAAEKNHWKNCNPCACLNTWIYNSTAENRCFNDKVWGEKWCYVEGYAHCKAPTGIASTVAGEGRHYRTCGREVCGDHKKMYKGSQCCGAPTKKWPHQMVM